MDLGPLHDTSGNIQSRRSRESSNRLCRQCDGECFLGQEGLLLCEFMPAGTTINANRYCETLENLRRAIQNKRRGVLTKGVRFHQDNARPHIACVTIDLINKCGWDTVTHPPYSPDLAPSDYHLFPELKKYLDVIHFRTEEELKEEVLSYLRGMAVEFYDVGINKMVHHMQKCIDLHGDYVEK